MHTKTDDGLKPGTPPADMTPAAYLAFCGQRIAQFRRQIIMSNGRPMSITELARRVHVSRPFLSNLEAGRFWPRLERLLQICVVLNIDPRALFPSHHSPALDRLILLLEQVDDPRYLDALTLSVEAYLRPRPQASLAPPQPERQLA